MNYSQLWFSEYHTPNVYKSWKIKKCLYSGVSKYQTIDVFETHDYGRMLVLDGYVMTTERDEFVYHEMITHVPAFTHPSPQRALVIGGGDGGTIRELAKHPSLSEIILCEIDEEVVRVSKEFLPDISCALSGKDKRVKVICDDGFAFVQQYQDYFDLIIIDSTDPIGPGKILFTEEFYGHIHRALTKNGIMANQAENIFYDLKIMSEIFQNLSLHFSHVKSYNAGIPSYPSGHWSFGLASKQVDPLHPAGIERFNQNFQTRYYSDNLHSGIFCLPRYQEEALNQSTGG